MIVEDINVDNIWLDENSYENIFVYNIRYKKIMDAKPLPIRSDKVDRIIKIYDGIRYLELSNFYNEVYYGINSRISNAIFDRINHIKLIARIKIDSYNSLPLPIEKNGF